MSRQSITLKADGLKVVCTAKQRYAVAIATPQRLLVVKRTDSLAALRADLRRHVRELPNRNAYVFDLRTGALLFTLWPGAAAPADGDLARIILNGGQS